MPRKTGQLMHVCRPALRHCLCAQVRHIRQALLNSHILVFARLLLVNGIILSLVA